MFAYCMNNPVMMSDPSGHWPSWGTILKAAAIVVVAAAIVTAVVVTVATYGAGSVAGVAMITGALTIAAKATEVAILQAKKSTSTRSSNSGKSSSGNSSGGGNGSSGGGSSGGGKKSGGQVAADVIDAVFNNGITILTPSATKALTTGAAFAKDDLFNNPVLNSNFNKFITGPAKPLGMVTAYGFAAYAWGQTTISIFSDDPAQRAMDRGYRLK